MILAFEPPPELIELVWRAANAAAIVVNRELDDVRRIDHRRHGRAPVVVPTQVIGGLKLRSVARARRMMAVLVRRHVLCARHDSEGTGRIVIHFGEPASDARKSKCVPLSTPMLGFLVGRDHSTFCTMPMAADPAFAERVDAADRELSAMYPPGRIVCTATFRGRIHQAAKEETE